MHFRICVKCIPKRYLIAILAFFGYIVMFCLRTNLSMATVEMTTDRRFQNGSVRLAEFNWNSNEKALVLSAFSYGYLVIVAGGILANRFGGATMYGIGIAVTAVLTLFTSFLLHLNFYAFIVARAVEGIFEAFSCCSMSELWSRWSPPEERSKLVSISFTGVYFGLTISYPLCGYVSSLWGWEAMFYVTGGTALVWYAFWFTLVSNDPASDKHLSSTERAYLAAKIKRGSQKQVTYPWKRIFKSRSVWILCIVEFLFSCGYTIVILYLPQYIRDMKVDAEIKDIGFISSIPHLCATISHPFAGYLADYIRQKKYLSQTNVHKLYICTGLVMGSILLSASGFCSNFMGKIIYLSLYRLFTSCCEVAFHVSVIDMAPQFASVLFGIAVFFFGSAAIVSPHIIGFIVKNNSNTEWNNCFILFSGFYLIAALLYLLFSNSSLQPWANQGENMKVEEIEKDKSTI